MRPESSTDYTDPMGFNPHRETGKAPFDIAVMAIAIVVTIGVVAWAIFGG